jgi:hypothetical protein
LLAAVGAVVFRETSIIGGKTDMKNSLRILLVLGIIMGMFPITVWADPVTDADVSIDFIIDDGDSADLHDDFGWLVAGSGATSTIRVNYTGNVSPDIHFVKFVSVEKEIYGDVTVKEVTGVPYETVFSASENTAGNAPIGLHMNYTVNGTGYDYYRTVYQPIDHATPMTIRSIAFESEVTIAKMMNITMMMGDIYGNAVTSLYEDATGGIPETVTFETTTYAGSGFYDGDGYDAESVPVSVNTEGVVVAPFRVGTEAGPKYLIHILPAAAVDDKWLTITALADAEPYAITVSVVPNVDSPPYIPADGESKFYLTYALSDRYGNPSGNQAVCFTDDVVGDVFTQRTNSNGQIMFTFGPFDTVATFTIHAEAVANASVAVDQRVRFTNTSPEEMLLTANPQSMPSADVTTAGGADILAKVMDENGNGVPGEEVSFWIPPVSDYSDNQTAEPALEAATAVTNVDGIATVHFTPGAFETDMSDVNYSATASESCTVVAIWGAKSRSIVLEWKNYPYLRVETSVDPATVEVGKPVDVTVRLIGDGWALNSEPIDTMLCVDRSGSMLSDLPDRMLSLMSALKVFNAQMVGGRDRIGLVSFGGYTGVADISSGDKRVGIDNTGDDDSQYVSDHYKGNGKTYTDHATLDLPLTLDRSTVEDTVDYIVPSSWTSMRYGLYLSINEIIANPHDGAVQAVILLSDGDYNWYGDPLARGNPGDQSGPAYSTGTKSYYPFDNLSVEEQNLSIYAGNHNITIYSIAFGNGISYIGKDTLEKLAQNTGGKYYYAPTGDDLAGIYTSIAGELKNEAGVNTEMDVKFDTIELNNVSTENTIANPILAYEYVDGVSTLVSSWNASGSEASPNIIHDLTLDQTDDWVANRGLSFDSSEIGTIYLGQTWQAVFRLNVTKAGNINIFGDGSAIYFNNGTDSLTLPKTYITAVDNLAATGINFASLQVYDLFCTEAEHDEVIENYLTVNWNLDYSGSNTTTQYLYYQNVDDGFWTMFSMFDTDGPVSGGLYTKQLYVADFLPGRYKLRVRAIASDAPDSVIETLNPISIGKGMRNYILLE